MAPALFTFGLRTTPGATASLLLNLETVLTVAIAWFVFREHRNARVVTGMALIVAAGVLLAGAPGEGGGSGALLIALACLCWAMDNNSTRRIAGNDAMLIAAAKGLRRRRRQYRPRPSVRGAGAIDVRARWPRPASASSATA